MDDILAKKYITDGVLCDRYTTMTRYSVAFDSTDSQVFMYAKNRLPKFLATNPTHSASFFTDDVVQGFWPNTSLRPLIDLSREKHLIVATSVSTLIAMNNNTLVKNKVLYAYDLFDLQRLKTTPMVRTLYAGVRIITRNKDYAKLLYDTYGLICSDSHYMMEFDFNKIKEIYG